MKQRHGAKPRSGSRASEPRNPIQSIRHRAIFFQREGRLLAGEQVFLKVLSTEQSMEEYIVRPSTTGAKNACQLRSSDLLQRLLHADVKGKQEPFLRANSNVIS
ncbi:unnamed protein product [Calypogeia fissa]